MKWDSFTVKPKIEFKSKMEKFASDMFSEAITQGEEEPYTPQLRGSSLPICILLHAQEVLKPHVRPVDARLEHYAIQGTVFHEWFQKKLMQSKKWGRYLYGDWECPRCKTVHLRSATRPKNYRTYSCSTCGSSGLQYRELEAKYKGVIGIHVDTVLKFPGDRFWVWEYKTTGRFNIDDPKMEFKPKHFHQASTYPIILEDQFGFFPERFFIGYVNRDAPQYSMTSQRQHRWFPFKTNTEIVERRRWQLDRIVEGEKARLRYMKKPTLKNLERLDSLRPCHSKEDYYAPLLGMNDRFEKGDSCPYLKRGRCACFKAEGLTKAALDLHKMVTGEGGLQP